MRNCPRRLVFWWSIPCKAISDVFRELSTSYEVTAVFTSGLSDDRQKLGWELPELGAAAVVFLSETNWSTETKQILRAERDALHIFNGIHPYQRIRHALRLATQARMLTAVMSEAPNNSFTGLKWLAKEIYVRWLLPLKTRPTARNTLFVLCLSGAAEPALQSLGRLGFPTERIFPFGYFSEPPKASGVSNPDAHRRVVRIVCTGYLTRNKGHALLLAALTALRHQGHEFLCDITGYGPEESVLRAKASALGLDGCVIFHGVLPTAELDALQADADIFVAPGLREPWGIRVNEAIQAGLAVIVSDGVGACELVKSSGCGSVFLSGDRDSLAGSLASLMSNPVRLAECRAKAADYRHHIHPRVAASYLADVIRHSWNPSLPRPVPPWLEYS